MWQLCFIRHSNGELLGTSRGKRQDVTLVWIINILLHSLACISRLFHSWAAFSLAYGSWKYHAHSCNNSRYCMLTSVIRCIYRIAGNFRDQTLACENLFLRKFLPQKFSCWWAEEAVLRRPSWGGRAECIWAADPVVEPSSMDNIVPRVVYYTIYASSKLRKFFATYDNSPVITATANRSSELARSLWHDSSSPTATDTLW